MRERLEHRADVEWMLVCSAEDTIRGRIRIGGEGSNRLRGMMTSSIRGIPTLGRTLDERQTSLKLELADSGFLIAWRSEEHQPTLGCVAATQTWCSYPI